MNKQSGFGLVRFFAVIAVIAVIGGAAYVMMQPDSGTSMPIGENPGDIHEDENVAYENTVYGIGFSYPDNYVITERDMPGSAERGHHVITLMDRTAANIPVGGEGPTTITVEVFQNNIDTQTPENWIKNTSVSNYKLSTDGIIKQGFIVGTPSLTYTWDGLYRGESTVIEHRDNVVVFSVTTMTATDQIRYDFDGVLSSVTLK